MEQSEMENKLIALQEEGKEACVRVQSAFGEEFACVEWHMANTIEKELKRVMIGALAEECLEYVYGHAALGAETALQAFRVVKEGDLLTGAHLIQSTSRFETARRLMQAEATVWFLDHTKLWKVED